MNYPEPYKISASKYYQFTYTNPDTGKRTQKSTKCERKVEARQFIHDFIKNLSRGFSQLTFEEYAKPYFIWDQCPHVARLLAEGKIIGKRHCNETRRLLEKYLPGTTLARLKMFEIRRGHILDYRTDLLSKTTANQANKAVQALKSVLSEAFYREDIQSNPGAGIGRIKSQLREKRIIPKEIIAELFSSPELFSSELLHMFLKTLAFTGARFSEITALSWGQIEGPICKINRAHKAWGSEIGLPKWDKIREIYLPDSITSMLEYWKEESFQTKDEDLVFCYDDGTRLGNSNPRKRFYQVIEKLIPDRKEQNITAHSLRHSLNTHLLSLMSQDSCRMKNIRSGNNEVQYFLQRKSSSPNTATEQ